MRPRLVLASASPARAELLREAGFEFEARCAPEAVERAAVEAEIRRGRCGPGELSLAAARAKAAAVAAGTTAPAVVLGADTVTVSAGGRLLGKGADAAGEARILAELAGTRHRVITGVVLLAVPGKTRRELVAESAVELAALSAAEIAAYVASGSARSAAGAYRIQRGGAERWARVVAGSFSNVVGLPMEAIIPLLAELGVRPAKSKKKRKGRS